ncbi:MAG: ABC transporter substrate-binding protein [Thiohalocapsa sp.]
MPLVSARPVPSLPVLSGGVLARRTRPAMLLLALILPPSLLVAADRPLTPPERVIKQVSDGLMRVLREDRRLLETNPAYVHRLVDELFLPNIDLDRVSALVLGRYWRDATKTQRRLFQSAFKDLLVNTYAHAVHSLSAWEIRYLRPRLSGDPNRVLVRTEILRPRGDPVAVDYRMIRSGGRWLAYDVAVEGISLLTNYRSTFTGIARERGIEGLIGDLQRRNATAAGVTGRQ